MLFVSHQLFPPSLGKREGAFHLPPPLTKGVVQQQDMGIGKQEAHAGLGGGGSCCFCAHSFRYTFTTLKCIESCQVVTFRIMYIYIYVCVHHIYFQDTGYTPHTKLMCVKPCQVCTCYSIYTTCTFHVCKAMSGVHTQHMQQYIHHMHT